MGIADLLGSHPFFGGVIAVLAGITFVAWDYVRLEPSGRWLSYALTMRRIAIVLAVISTVLIASRFVSVLAGAGNL
jgi:hypothetical protein